MKKSIPNPFRTGGWVVIKDEAIKIAADVASFSDKQSVDAVLALGLMNKDNLAEYISMIPLYERVMTQLAKLLLSIRVGMSGVSERVVQNAMHALSKVVKRPSKRLGRGHGSGRGKTAGRGTKGQKARGKMPAHFEGGQLSIVRRLPYLRGKGRNKSRKEQPVRVAVSRLSQLPAKTAVTIETLVKAGIVEKGTVRVKVLGNGTLDTALTVTVPCSEGAKKLIEKAGGSVE